MNNFFTLLKYSLIDSFKLNKLKKKQSGLRIELVVGLVYLLIFAFVTVYMFAFMQIFNEIGASDLIFLFAIVMSSFITLISTLTKANVYIFRTKDYELLMGLPIEPRVIVATKITNLYILNFIFVFTICGAVDISYFIVCGFDIITLLISLVVIFLLPLFPIVLSSVIAFLLGFIPFTQKTKNILSTILYVSLSILMMVGYFSIMNVTDDQFALSISEIYQKIGNLYFLGLWAFEAIVNKNIIKFLLFIGVSIISFILYVLVVGKYFLNINNLLNTQKTLKNYNLKNEKFNSSKGEIKTLLFKELKMYLGFPSYIINTIIGPIMSIIAIVMFALQYDTLKVTIETLFSSLGITVNQNIFLILMGLLNVFFVSLVTTTASSVSLEGKSFWIIKSAPVKTTSVFWSKIILNLLINIPAIFISMVIASFIIKGNIVFAIASTIIPILYSISGAFLGLYFNILKPNFNYDNPIKPVKQDLPVLFSMLISFGISIICFGLLLGLIKFLELWLILLIELTIAIIFFTIATTLLFKNGVKKFENIAG